MVWEIFSHTMALGEKAMKPEDIAPINAPSGSFHRTSAPPRVPVRKPSDVKLKEIVQRDQVKSPGLDHIQFNKLEVSNTDARDIAQEIRNVNQSLETINAHVRQMRASLESIVKIYPPYPPGSSERVEALRQFSAIRKMIDQIAHPKHTNGLENILGDPARNPRSGDWTLKIGNRQADLVIQHQPSHTGSGGLDLPELGLDSSDRQITAAIEKTSMALPTLHSRHREFIADANRVISQIA